MGTYGAIKPPAGSVLNYTHERYKLMQSLYVFNDPNTAHPYFDIAGPGRVVAEGSTSRGSSGEIIASNANVAVAPIPYFTQNNWCYACSFLVNNSDYGAYGFGIDDNYHGFYLATYPGYSFVNYSFEGQTSNFAGLPRYTLLHACIRNVGNVLRVVINGSVYFNGTPSGTMRAVSSANFYMGGQRVNGENGTNIYHRFVCYSSAIMDQQMIDDTTAPYDMFPMPPVFSPRAGSGQIR